MHRAHADSVSCSCIHQQFSFDKIASRLPHSVLRPSPRQIRGTERNSNNISGKRLQHVRLNHIEPIHDRPARPHFAIPDPPLAHPLHFRVPGLQIRKQASWSSRFLPFEQACQERRMVAGTYGEVSAAVLILGAEEGEHSF